MNLKTLREKAGITQTALSEILGISQSAISMWEIGESKPKTEMLPKLAKALNCNINDLFKEEEGENDE